MSVNVVIGAGLGDEGKGLITDFFCDTNERDTVVVRFNGGAQAGHTVVTPEGKRHVFHHVGSGTFSGAGTFLSKHMVCHPMFFEDELNELNNMGISEDVLVDPRAVITTPYDIMINQALEMSRGNERHGSCGMGFGETIERKEKDSSGIYTLTVNDLYKSGVPLMKLRNIRDQYVPKRLNDLKLPPLEDHLKSDNILERFLEDLSFFRQNTWISDLDYLSDHYDIVFEGAQGLLLDMDYGSFPHVTRSNTGLKNVIDLAREASIEELEVTYVTRCYTTRHGAGPLPYEMDEIPYEAMRDKTNKNNEWQSNFRYGWLSIDMLVDAIRHDLLYCPNMVQDTNLAVTCLDQVDDDNMPYYQGGVKKRGTLDLMRDLYNVLPEFGFLQSIGPCRDDIY